ncbi:unnamed protein product [Schistosoma curassoni]|nr:unnamed protein product [Schistosoma curassoni]
MSSPLCFLVLFVTVYESKCFCGEINLHCKQITDREIILQWTNQRFYSKPLLFIQQKINEDKTYYPVDAKQHTLTIKTNDTCIHYEFKYMTREYYKDLFFSNYNLHYIPQMFENIQYRTISPTRIKLKWDMKKTSAIKS